MDLRRPQGASSIKATPRTPQYGADPSINKTTSILMCDMAMLAMLATQMLTGVLTGVSLISMMVMLTQN